MKNSYHINGNMVNSYELNRFFSYFLFLQFCQLQFHFRHLTTQTLILSPFLYINHSWRHEKITFFDWHRLKRSKKRDFMKEKSCKNWFVFLISCFVLIRQTTKTTFELRGKFNDREIKFIQGQTNYRFTRLETYH